MMIKNTNLSKREKEVAEFLLQGKSNKQIALALGIAESTVEFHLRNVYLKLQVGSRAEAILKLGKSIGLITAQPRESIVEKESSVDHTGGKFVSMRKVIDMNNRWRSYLLAGLVFGAFFWFYFSGIGQLANNFSFSINRENVLATWAFLTIEFLLIFGVWLIPTIYPARSEFRHSKKIRLSVLAVVVMWVSAILGYYLTYVILLAFVGLPHMDYYLVFGQHGSTFWQDWATLFPKLILSKFLQWTVVGTIVGGLAGLVTSGFYSFWIKKTNTILPA